MMTTMAPMLEVMKKKMGKKRFTQLMQTMGPMVEKMGSNGGGFGGGFGGFDMSSFGGFEQYITPETVSGVMTLAMSSGGHRKGRKARRYH